VPGDGSERQVRITQNIFTQLDGTLAGLYALGHSSCLMAFRNNLVSAITAPAAASQSFAGVVLCSDPSTGAPRGELVQQNTFVGVAAGAGANRGALALCRNGTVSENIFRSNSPRDLDLLPGNAQDVVRNVYDLAPDEAIGGQDSGNVNIDPRFVNPGAGDYRLQPISPAINIGASFTDIPRDLDGNPRRVGSRTDLGAYESNLDDLTQILVTNSADSGAGSLRQAILDANANADHNLIRFAIPGSCGSQGILLLSPLPDITTPVTIDGYTQAGAAPTTIDPGFDAQVCVGLTQVGSLSHALRAQAGGRLTVRGLWFGNFDAGGAVPVRFDAGSDHVLEGSQFAGTLPNGASVSANRVAVRIGAATNVRIGGPASAQRNWISGALAQGIAVTGAGIGVGIVIQNNLVGTDAAGTGALANGGSGITISNSGGIEILGNLIGGNASSGISISGDSLGVVIRGNRIGGWLPPHGNVIAQSIPNGSHGIQVLSGSLSVVVGGSEAVDGGSNDIVANGGAGVAVTEGNAVRVRANRIFGNTGLGIDLGALGVTSNDPLDADTGANDLQNFPTTSSASTDGVSLAVAGSLNSQPGNYAIDVYASNAGACDPTSHGEGQRWIGRVDMTIAVAGPATFSANLPYAGNAVAAGQSVTATATRLGPTNIGDTSEFSTCRDILPGDGTLFADGFEDS
jgi:hypothetical protein